MCCFTGKFTAEAPVEVSNTRIFARFIDRQTQALVYQMTYRAKESLAMVLPIPTADKTTEDAVKFISLKSYKTFFDDLQKGFPAPQLGVNWGGGGRGAPGAVPLKVQEVGDFIASFVPSVADFDRLDEKFRLPGKTWDQLPKQKTYGFAVFQLKPEATEVHPMAFTFPTRTRLELFFPTVHIHDGDVHETAEFDHMLYLQPRAPLDLIPRQWAESTQPASMFVNQREAQELLNPDLHIFRRQLKGKLKNVDLFV